MAGTPAQRDRTPLLEMRACKVPIIPRGEPPTVFLVAICISVFTTSIGLVMQPATLLLAAPTKMLKPRWRSLAANEGSTDLAVPSRQECADMGAEVKLVAKWAGNLPSA
mmetsp:Transcript_28605/g.59466  ORF Transcript_28605/g.59466 Transcript_28605/m.59466 type:complete len:109 (-) Transcript_28605:18-344(-)